MLLLDFLNDLAKKSKVPVDQEELANFIKGNSNLAQIDFPDSIVGTINKELITLEDAKNNITLKNGFISDFAKGIDKLVIGERLDDMEFTDDQKTQIANEKSTGKKVALSLKFLRAQKVKTVGGEAAKKQLEEAQNRIKALEDDVKSKVEATTNEWSTKYNTVNSQLNNIRKFRLFSEYNWNETIPSDTREEIALSRLNKVLSDNKGKLVSDGNGFKLINSDDPDGKLAMQIDGKTATLKSITDLAMTGLISTVPISEKKKTTVQTKIVDAKDQKGNPNTRSNFARHREARNAQP